MFHPMEEGNLAFVHSNGEKSITVSGVYYSCPNPISFRIKENISFQELKEKIRQVTINSRNIFELFYRSPYLDKNGVLMYGDKLLLCNDDVNKMFMTFFKFRNAGPIELYATFSRSVEEILSLLEPPTQL
jgi:hypothetical protein